jgi:nitrous oxidase accessory protein NosD
VHFPKALSSLFVTAFVFAIAPHAAVTAQGHTAVLKVPGDYPTISAAIAAASPGDTVRVAGGTYREQVVIDKAIKLHGAGRENTIIDGENRTDLTSLGQVRVIAAGDVEVSGFTITRAGRHGAASPGPAGYYVAIYTESSVAGVTFDIHHNRVIEVGEPGNPASEFWGLGFLAGPGLQDLDFHHNDISRTTYVGFWCQGHVGPQTIRDNVLRGAIVGGSDGLYVVMGTGSGPLRILRNSIDMGAPQINPGFITGISVFGNGADNVEIVGNTIYDIIENRRGINLIGGESAIRGAVIANNRILGAGGYTGITVWGGCEDTAVENNLITGITGLAVNTPGTNGGIRLRAYAGIAATPVRTWIMGNTIEALRGITVEATSSSNQIYGNRIRALDFPAVQLGAATTLNLVGNNVLRTPAQRGNAAVLDQGTSNTVVLNH